MMSTDSPKQDRTNHTKPRHVRVPDKLWVDAATKANDEGATNISEVVRALLRGYVDGRFVV